MKLGDATFLIGSNNAGKSTTLKIIECLLSNKKQLDQRDFYSEIDLETGETKVIERKIVIEAEFRDLPSNAGEWRGFKGRIFKYKGANGNADGLSIFYRKTYEIGKDVVVELKSLKREIKPEFIKCKKPQDFIDAGVNSNLVDELFSVLDKNIAAKDKINLEAIDDIWNVSDEEDWFSNPGGIPGNVLSKLPKFLLIPADSSAHEINDVKSGVLGKTLNELFEDVRSTSENYKEAQVHLNKLAKELDPADTTSEFGKMMVSLNSVLSSVFPDTQIHAVADLTDPKVLKPSFEVEMSSNIRTTVENQGTGMVRSAVFGLLRFRQQWLNKKENDDKRSLIIGFEEPEIYLHPSAANQLRDTIYELSGDNTQIIATTHSPYLIDISRKPRQILNRFHYENSHTTVTPFSVSDEYKKLEGDDKQHVKMLLRLDDYVSRVFFTKRVILVEGDTEDIVLREAISRLPADIQCKIKSNCEVIKARGKASIIGVVKYLNALNIDCFVIHDRDAGCANAENLINQ
ncbi:AAA family ATPase [Moritella viscosa]|uniref:AAA family ATPase n=1 Tax=Moritella viscosa TaxID=80854 RepID=UPI00267648B5|nr:AAA family ATPase [Moritella viscosa]